MCPMPDYKHILKKRHEMYRICFQYLTQTEYTSYEEYCLLDSPLFLNNVLIYKTKVAAIKSVFSLIALLMLATLITAATSFQTTLAQPMIGDGSNMNMGNGRSAGMNFNPMSLANNMFNASSIYGSVGISMVSGVKVTSINLLENNEISVTLRHSAAADTATANNVNASTMSPPPPRVTVTAIRAPMNLKDLMSLASQSSKMMTDNTSNTMSNPMMMGGGPLQGFGGAVNNGTNNVNPLSFLTDLQIGSSSTSANADWKVPQIVRMGLTGMMGGTNNNRSTASTADFIIVTVIPYTGKTTTASAAG
jgi:hypothetical protein